MERDAGAVEIFIPSEGDEQGVCGTEGEGGMAQILGSDRGMRGPFLWGSSSQKFDVVTPR